MAFCGLLLMFRVWVVGYLGLVVVVCFGVVWFVDWFWLVFVMLMILCVGNSVV